MRSAIPVENGDTLAAMRGFLKMLLEKGVVDTILVPMATPSGAVIPALVADPALIDAADPLAPVMGLNAARVAGPVSVREPRGRVAAVLRPCEARALVELVKLQQAAMDDLIVIAVDCLGTYTVPDYEAMRVNGGPDRDALLKGLASGELRLQEGYQLRDACQMCERPHADAGADVILELFGADLTAQIPISLSDDLAGALGLAAAEADGKRAEVIDKVVAERTGVRDARFAEIRAQLADGGVEGVFAACVRCHNCMTTCPICYCKTCLFKSPVFEHDPVQYLSWARRKGAYRLPADTMLFQLTRLNHMVLSCIGCGVCSDACPADLPVARVFRAIGDELQRAFEYVPGRSVEDPLPLITFREDEWSEAGEER